MVFSFLTSNHFFNNGSVHASIFTIGLGFLLIKTISLVNWLLSSLQPAIDLSSRYGPKSWVVITGGSDGIGKAFANELADKGFNLVLISRTKSKLEEVQKEIKAKYPSVEVKIIPSDLTKSYQEGFAGKIYDQVSNLDISMLINNAGKGISKPYANIKEEEINDIVILNCLAHAQITRAFLPKLAARKQKTAMINVASIASVHPLPKLQIYAATKTFHDFLSRGLVYEHPNIDVMVLNPGRVSTAMTNYRKLDFETITPEQCAVAALKDLGKTDATFGHIKHKLQANIMSMAPKFVLNYYINNVLMKQSKHD